MAEQHLRGCALLALVAAVAVVAFIGGRLSVSGPGAGSPGGAVSLPPTAVPAVGAPPTVAVATATPTPRAVAVSRAAATPVATPATSRSGGATRAADPSPTPRPNPRPRATATPVASATGEPSRAERRARSRSRSVEASPNSGGEREGCDPSYPTVCIPPPPPFRDCGVTDERNFPVLPPDRHRLDSDNDGIGCEPIR